MTESMRQADFVVCAQILTCPEHATSWAYMFFMPCHLAYMCCWCCRSTLTLGFSETNATRHCLIFPFVSFDTRCCHGRSQVLRKLGMIDEEGIVTLKGRAACEIDTADELLTTEMMFNGTFNGLDKHQLVSLVSCLVPGEKSQVPCWKSLTGSFSLNQPETQHSVCTFDCLLGTGENPQICRWKFLT